MFPPMLIAKMVRAHAEAGMAAMLDQSTSDADRDKRQTLIESNAVGILDLMQERFMADGYAEGEAKNMSLLTMVVATASIMEVVANAGPSE